MMCYFCMNASMRMHMHVYASICMYTQAYSCLFMEICIMYRCIHYIRKKNINSCFLFPTDRGDNTLFLAKKSGFMAHAIYRTDLVALTFCKCICRACVAQSSAHTCRKAKSRPAWQSAHTPLGAKKLSYPSQLRQSMRSE